MVVELIAGAVAVLVLLVVVGYSVSVYNQLVSLDERTKQAKQDIDVLLKQRQDELTKLIDAAKETMDHEEELLTSLTEAREQAERASTPKEQAKADAAVQNALGSFRARVEDYPELKSQGNMLQFQEKISELESKIADRREMYNEAVTQYNTRTSQFPYVIMARQFGYQDKELFQAPESELEDVDVGEAFA